MAVWFSPVATGHDHRGGSRYGGGLRIRDPDGWFGGWCGEGPHPVDGGVQVLIQPPDVDGGFLEVLGEVEPVVRVGLLGLLTGGFEEVREAFEGTVDRIKNLLDELGGLVVGLGAVEPVGQSEETASVDV